jgi:UDP-glucose 4-epimerase
MKVLVTGGAGFIGSHVTDRLVESGHEVVAIDDLSTGRRENVHARARFVRMDLLDPGLAEFVKRERPDVIDHHAAQVDVRRSVADPLHDIRVNVEATVALAMAGVSAGAKRFVFASSGGAIYGDTDRCPTPEDTPERPASPYGCSKLAAEKYLFALAAVHGFRVVCLRYANVYGPRQSAAGEAGVVAIFCSRLLAGQTPVIHGDGLQTRDFVCVSDVAEANIQALGTPEDGVFNIGTATETSVVELFRMLCAAIGSAIGVQHGPAKAGEQRRSVLDWSLAGRALGWRPRRSLAAGLRETIDHFRSGGH